MKIQIEHHIDGKLQGIFTTRLEVIPRTGENFVFYGKGKDINGVVEVVRHVIYDDKPLVTITVNEIDPLVNDKVLNREE